MAKFESTGSGFDLKRWWRHGDTAWSGIVIAMAFFVLVIMVAIGWSVWSASAASRAAFGWSFVAPTADSNWDPVNSLFQAWPIITGTLTTAIITIIIATPISIAIAIFMSELCPTWLRQPLSFMVELLAAIPSVVYGLWGIFVFLPQVVAPFGKFLGETLGWLPLFAGSIPPSGTSRLAASLILTIMVTPTITAVTRDVLLAIPNAQREAALAIGATQWEMIWQVLLPYGLSGILGAVILGLGRALGETMAVTMVIGNNTVESTGSLLVPGATLASTIANEFAEAVTKLHTSALIELGLILFVITLILNMVARLLVWRVASLAPTDGRA